MSGDPRRLPDWQVTFTPGEVAQTGRAYPDTRFVQLQEVDTTPPDTRTRFTRLFKSAPKPVRQWKWVYLGHFTGSTTIGMPHNGGHWYYFFNPVTGEQKRTSHDFYTEDFPDGFAIFDPDLPPPHLRFRTTPPSRPRLPPTAPPAEEDPSSRPRRPPTAPPAEADEDPTLPGGRRRARSRVKKQTRRTQGKRRKTVRKKL